YEQLIKLQVIVAKTAWNRRATREILVDKRAHDVALKPLLMVNNVVRNPKMLCDMTSVVHVLDGAASALRFLRHALTTSQPPLIPELHSQAHHGMTIRLEHGRHGGRI